jgi:hypothetical protein
VAAVVVVMLSVMGRELSFIEHASTKIQQWVVVVSGGGGIPGAASVSTVARVGGGDRRTGVEGAL